MRMEQEEMSQRMARRGAGVRARNKNTIGGAASQRYLTIVSKARRISVDVQGREKREDEPKLSKHKHTWQPPSTTSYAYSVR
jgi:hypothetical protein